jgi:uncharacterized membrane protein
MVGCDYVVMNQPQVIGSTNSDTQCVPNPNDSVAAEIVTYERLKTDIFEAQCLRCHSTNRPTAGVDLSTAAGAKAFATQIDFQVSRGLMPPSQSLTPEERGLVSDWIRTGAKSESDLAQNCEIPSTPVLTPPVDTLPNAPQPPTVVVDTPPQNPSGPLLVMPADSEINFALVRDRVFAFECMACHSDAGGNRAGLNLETYANAIDELDDIEEEVSEDSMPPRSRLRPIDKDIILRWIALGAPQ